MSENKKITKEEINKKNELEPKKTTAIRTKPSTKNRAIAPMQSADLWQEFDNTFSRFRDDFENLLFPAKWFDSSSIIPQVRVPVVDLEDNGKEYLVKAEMPGFKKEDVEIEVQDNAVQITGYAGWKYDQKGKLYVCKERACETFYREFYLPEEVKIEDVKANLSDGILEISLPKKAPKQKRKVTVK